MENHLRNNDKSQNQELQETYFNLTKYLAKTDRRLKDKQSTLLETLDRMVPYGHCYLVYDMQAKAITHRRGIQGFLGFDENAYTMNDYLDSLHPALKAMQGMYSTGFVKALTQGNLTLDIETTYFHYSQAIKHRNGHYLFVRRTLIPFDYTPDNRLLAWLNLFTLINDYEIHPFKFQGCSFDTITSDGKKDQSQYERYVHAYITKELSSQRKVEILRTLLNPNGRKTEDVIEGSIFILNEYATEKYPSAKNIARRLFHLESPEDKKKAIKTVNNRCSALVQTMHDTYKMDKLSSAKDIAEFFQSQGLLPLGKTD
jgi:hypothetical protein